MLFCKLGLLPSRLIISFKFRNSSISFIFYEYYYVTTGTGQYFVDKLDPFECTHYIYGFAVLDDITYEMKVYDPYIDIDLGGYRKFTELKLQNRNLKTLIAIGGWNDSAFSNKYSILAADPVKRANFVSKALAFVRQVKLSNLFEIHYLS